ncbi:MAG: MBL fold metallo-hydrolase [Ignavibacteria bacterium]|nr:MAG: MBL fold metallo-hydrolase [Ignavibacteria bacterium]
MKIGKYDLIPLETGTFGLDGGAMFGIIPKPLWERTNPADEKNRIKLGARCLLLKSNDKNILIDTGVGSYWDEKFYKIYDLQNQTTNLENSLTENGITPDQIDEVLLTHLHFDHTGGSTKFEGGKWVPAFPNAKYIVQKEHYEWAINPSDRDRGSFIKNRFEPLREEGVLELTNEKQFDDEIEAVIINGHTFSQQMIKISDSSNTLLYCGDLLPTSSHIPIPYVMGYDLQPLITVKEKKEILPKAVDENWILFFEHDPYCIAGTVEKTDKGFKLKEKVDL